MTLKPYHQVLNLCVIAWQAIVAVAPVPNNASTRTDTETGKPQPPEGRSAMEVEADLVQQSHDDEAGSVSTAKCGAFAAESVVRGLVRCLCGVVVGRWKQTAKARKKAWVLHAMEAVHALVRTLEVGLLLVLAWHRRRTRVVRGGLAWCFGPILLWRNLERFCGWLISSLTSLLQLDGRQ